MDFMTSYWSVIATILIFIGGGIFAVMKFLALSTTEKYAKIQGWLLQAVLAAEKEFGSGTGRLKLSAVYDKFVGQFPWLAKITTYAMFSQYVDDALEEMKSLLRGNGAIAEYVETKEAK